MRNGAIIQEYTGLVAISACGNLGNIAVSTYLLRESTPQDLVFVDKKPLPFLGIHVVVPNLLKNDWAILRGEMPVDYWVISHQIPKLIKIHLLPHVIGEI